MRCTRSVSHTARLCNNKYEPELPPSKKRGEEVSVVTATPLCILTTIQGPIAQMQGPLRFELGWPEAPRDPCWIRGQDTHQPAVQPQGLGEPTFNGLPPPPERGAAKASPQGEYLWGPLEFASCRRFFRLHTLVHTSHTISCVDVSSMLTHSMIALDPFHNKLFCHIFYDVQFYRSPLGNLKESRVNRGNVTFVSKIHFPRLAASEAVPPWAAEGWAADLGSVILVHFESFYLMKCNSVLVYS